MYYNNAGLISIANNKINNKNVEFSIKYEQFKNN